MIEYRTSYDHTDMVCSYPEAKLFTGSPYELCIDKDLKTLVIDSYQSISDDVCILSCFIDYFHRKGVKLIVKNHTKPPLLDTYINFLDKQRQFYSNFKSLAIRSKLQKLNKLKKRTGDVPWGFQVDNGTLVPNQYEQSVTQKVINLHKEGLTYYRIAKLLNQQGYKRRVTSEWLPLTVKRIIDDYPKHLHIITSS